MSEENLINESGEVEQNNSDYIAAINQLKQTTVDKTKYDKLKAENKQLLDAIVNGQQIELPKSHEVDVEALRKKLYGSDVDLSNLDYVTATLELRDALIERGEEDPFLPHGHKITPNDTDRALADKVATVLRECVEDADGDSQIFTKELQRRMNN